MPRRHDRRSGQQNGHLYRGPHDPAPGRGHPHQRRRADPVRRGYARSQENHRQVVPGKRSGIRDCDRKGRSDRRNRGRTDDGSGHGCSHRQHGQDDQAIYDPAPGQPGDHTVSGKSGSRRAGYFRRGRGHSALQGFDPARRGRQPGAVAQQRREGGGGGRRPCDPGRLRQGGDYRSGHGRRQEGSVRYPERDLPGSDAQTGFLHGEPERRVHPGRGAGVGGKLRQHDPEGFSERRPVYRQLRKRCHDHCPGSVCEQGHLPRNPDGGMRKPQEL